MADWIKMVYDDEISCDVRDAFLDYLNEGKSPEQATRVIVDDYLDEYDFLEDIEVMSLVYIGLSAIQLEKKCLQSEVRDTVFTLIELGEDLDIWKDANEVELRKREKVLSDLSDQLMKYKMLN